jgi:hypothetical protein
MLNVLDEFTHECLPIRIARWLKAIDVIEVLSDPSSWKRGDRSGNRSPSAEGDQRI